jgi:four helix bundle protein
MSEDRFRELRERSFRFAVDTCRFCRMLPMSWEGRRTADQLFRSATGEASNYRAAGQGRSRSEFISKMGTVVEEADESCFWLAFIEATGMAEGPELRRLSVESDELRSIFGASLATARENAARAREIRNARRAAAPSRIGPKR